MRMNRLFQALLDLLYPPRCIICRRLLREGERDVCPSCMAALPTAEGKRAEQTGEFFDLCVSPLYYTGSVRESFCRYKFQGAEGYAAPYARWMADCVREHLKDPFDLITWVPLSRNHLRKRGYDQARALACRMAEELGREAAPTLRKPKNRRTQSGLGGPEQRRANVLGAYELRRGAEVAGKRVLLVDDVVTTGATLSECARVLKTGGAESVVCVTLARSQKETGAGGAGAPAPGAPSQSRSKFVRKVL